MQELSNRRAKRQHKESTGKHLLALEKELNALYRAQRELPWEALDKPMFNGYVRTYVLRDDISRRKDAHMFQRILDKLNSRCYSKRHDFMAKKWHSRQYEAIQQPIHPIGKGEWDKLGWPEHYKRWFVFGIRYYTYKGGITHTFEGYWFSPDWMFVFKIDKSYITHIRKHDPEIESKITIINDTLYGNRETFAHLAKLHGGMYRSRWEECEPNKQKLIADELFKLQMAEFEEPYNDPNYIWKP